LKHVPVLEIGAISLKLETCTSTGNRCYKSEAWNMYQYLK